MKLNFKHLMLAASLFAAATGAFAQEYPSKPVKIIVGYPPSGVPDIVARRLGQKLAELTGQPFVVENKPGSGTAIASGTVAKSPPDGYTLMITDTPTHVMAAYQVKNLPYHPLKDFTPIAQLTEGAPVLVASAKTSIRTLNDLVREAKANPAKINYGSTGVGGLHHLMMAYLAHGAGIKLTHVPYKGSGQAVPALLTGEVSVLFTGLQAVMSHIKAGTVHLLAVADSTEATAVSQAGLPSVPFLSEVVKDFDFPAGIGLLAPGGMPKDVMTRLSALVKQAMESPDMVEFIRTRHMKTISGTPDEFAAYLVRTQKSYASAAKVANVQPE